jgi:hypothetical protein
MGVKIRQLINFLFCGYRRKMEKKCEPKPILAGTGAPASKNSQFRKFSFPYLGVCLFRTNFYMKLARATNDQTESGFVRLSLKIPLKHFLTHFHLLITSWNIGVPTLNNYMKSGKLLFSLFS